MDISIKTKASAFNSRPLKGNAANPPLMPIKGNRSEPQTGQPDAKAPAITPLPAKELSLAILFFNLILYIIIEVFKPNKTEIMKFDIKVK